MLFKKTHIPHIKNNQKRLNKTIYLLLMMCLFASSCRPRELSVPASSTTTSSSISHKIKVEEYLGIHFTKWRNIYFHDELSIYDYTTLISFEVPIQSFKLLLEQSPKLPSYGEFKKNARHSSFLQQFTKDIDWWKPPQLENAVYGTRTWCSQYEGDECVLYGNAVVSFAEVESGWVRTYICCQVETIPML